MTEQEIRRYLRQMKEEDSQTALQKFYDLCFDRFFRIAYYYLKQEEWAQEVVLDVFMKIWEKRESLQTIVNLEDYFFITVKNAALNYLAKEERQKQITEIIADKIANQENSPEEILINEELFPTMSKHWTVYRKNAGRYLSAYGKKNKAMHRSLKN